LHFVYRDAAGVVRHSRRITGGDEVPAAQATDQERAGVSGVPCVVDDDQDGALRYAKARAVLLGLQTNSNGERESISRTCWATSLSGRFPSLLRESLASL
jgi:hypothetical protein